MSKIRCRLCGDVIGVYEPMVVVANGVSRRTSIAVETVPEITQRNCFHPVCLTTRDLNGG